MDTRRHTSSSRHPQSVFLHHTSSSSHPPSVIINEISVIRHLLSNILHQSSFIIHPPSVFLHQSSFIVLTPSVILHQKSEIRNTRFPVNSGGRFCEDWTISKRNKSFSRMNQSSRYRTVLCICFQLSWSQQSSGYYAM